MKIRPTVVVPVTRAQIESGRDDGMPEILLCANEAAIYTIEPAARAEYRFKLKEKDAFDLTVDAQPNPNALVKVTRLSDHELQVTMKSNPKWAHGKAMLCFDALGRQTPPPPLDPLINNGGVRV